MRSISDVINKYSDEPFPDRSRGITTKISPESMVKLEALASHFGSKKTPLAGEILEGAINDIFEQVSGEFDEDLNRHYAEEMHELENRS